MRTSAWVALWLLGALSACGGEASEPAQPPARSQEATRRAAFFEKLRAAGEAYKAGEPERAVALWRGCLELDPAHEGCLVDLARTLRELGRRTEALEVLGRLRALHPDLPRPHFLLAEMLAEPADAPADALERAAALYGRALAIEPNVSGPRLGLARVQRRLGRADEAEASYRTVLGTNPDSREALAELGALLVDRERAAEAVGLLVRALDIGTRARGRRDVPSEMDTAESFDAASLSAPHNQAVLRDLAAAARALGGYPDEVPERFRQR